MKKAFSINEAPYSVRCLIYHNGGTTFRRVIIACHGFGGHKGNGASRRLAEYVLSRSKDAANRLQISMRGGNFAWTLPNMVVDRKWHHYAFVFESDDDDTKTKATLYYDHASLGSPDSDAHGPLPRRVSGHNLMIGEGSYDEPNLQFEMDALRFSKGVLPPERFLARAPSGLMLIIR
jgi:hypothetical protein